MSAADKRLYYKQNRLKQLRAFCHAARTNSVSKAAERLFLSQPAVSLQIKALERELDAVLFERNGPRIALTPEGETLLDLAAPLVEGFDLLPETFAARHGRIESGELDIAAGESTILYILPEYVRRFADMYPGISLRLRNVMGRVGLGQLRADEVDFAVGSMQAVPEDIDYQPTFGYDMVLITPLDHPLAGRTSVSLAEVSPYPLILPPRNLATWGIVDLVFSQQDVRYQVGMEAGGWEVIKKYVALGLGISIVSSICLSESEGLSIVSLGEMFPARTYGVVMRRGKVLSPAARRFISMLAPGFLDAAP